MCVPQYVYRNMCTACPARYGPSRGNYGGLPQTWSNSNISDAVTGSPGDNDPLDVLDISSIRAPIAGVYRVKVSLAFQAGGL
jgi:inorganic pyrophosphatase